MEVGGLTANGNNDGMPEHFEKIGPLGTSLTDVIVERDTQLGRVLELIEEYCAVMLPEHVCGMMSIGEENLRLTAMGGPKGRTAQWLEQGTIVVEMHKVDPRDDIVELLSDLSTDSE